ncbi:MAG: hypothetical protein RL885_32735 [Planctomycetota bacterium]
MKSPRFVWILFVLGLAACRSEEEGFTEEQRASFASAVSAYAKDGFENAGSLFSDLEVDHPEDPFVQFGLGTVAAAQADWDQAVEHFQKAAWSRDDRVAAEALFNLGNVSLHRAEDSFGEDPLAADDEALQTGMDQLEGAVRRYRDCLELAPDHENARYNLELIRTWLKHLRALLEEKARQEQRDKLDYNAFLDLIREQQTKLRDATHVVGRAPDTARRRQAVRDLARGQARLEVELPFLEDKLVEQVSQILAQQDPDVPDELIDQQIQPLIDLIGGIGEDMSRAARSLDESELEPVDGYQYGALRSLHELLVATSNMVPVLERALKDQKARVAASQQARSKRQNTEDSPDWEYLAKRQREMANTIQGVLFRAQKEEPMLRQSVEEAEAQEGEGDAGGDPTAGGSGAFGGQPLEVQKALLEAAELALELCPEAIELCGTAGDHLAAESLDDALPEQKRIQEILEKIAEPLPKKEQDQQQQQQNQDQQQQQDQQDQQQQGEQQDEGEQEQQQEEQESEDSPEEEKSSAEEPERKELTQEQAEAILRRAREREREYLEKKQELEDKLRKRKPKKDW